MAGSAHSDKEVPFRPARILMQDFTGVPAVVDLAAMRDGITKLGSDPQKVNPLIPVDLVIDHSVMVDVYARPDALQKNVDIEFERNAERYRFLRWGQEAFNNFRVVPPGTGICHQVNLEYLGQCVWTATENGETTVYPDTLYGTDSHTTMVNGLGILGWGVGGIEAEAAMLGQPIAMLIPDVIGFRLTGKLPEGATATDLVLTVTQMLRKKGVVGKFVEFFGPGLDELALADRATIGNMAPEYGATCGFFPIDKVALDYLRLTGRDQHRIALVEAYAKAQGMFRESGAPDPMFTDTLELDLSTVRPSLAGPEAPAGPGRPERRCLGIQSRAHQEPGRARERCRRESQGRGQELRTDAWRCGDRRDHLLHQHLQPLRAGRGRPRRAQGAGEGPDRQAMGEDFARPGIAGRYRIPGEVRPAEGPGCARLRLGRLWLHHLHRQLRPAGAIRSRTPSRTTSWSPSLCCPATATSKAACTRTSAPTTWRPRRWSWRTRCSAR